MNAGQAGDGLVTIQPADGNPSHNTGDSRLISVKGKIDRLPGGGGNRGGGSPSGILDNEEEITREFAARSLSSTTDSRTSANFLAQRVPESPTRRQI